MSYRKKKKKKATKIEKSSILNFDRISKRRSMILFFQNENAVCDEAKWLVKGQGGRNQETDDRPPTTVRWPAVTIIIFENERRD